MAIVSCRRSVQVSEILILLIYYSSCFYFCSSTTDIITLSSPLTEPEIIISSNKAFQLGFFSPANTTNRYIGIWYSEMMPDRIVIWVANREKPLVDSSGTMAISEDGNLVVLNGNKDVIWSSNVSTYLANSSAQLLDSGSLVLLDHDTGRSVWESFQHPTDSVIKEMKLTADALKQENNIVLNSWRSSSDPATGSFYAGIGARTIPEVFVWNGSRPYWRSGPWNSQRFIGVENMASEYQNRFIVEDNGDQGRVSMSFTYSDKFFIGYMFLDPQGNFWRKIWNRVTSESMPTWSSIQTHCDVYGKCGPFGSCSSKDSPICTCLRGFEPKQVEEWNIGNFTGGCVRRTPLQCDRNDSAVQEKNEDGFLKMTTMKVPDFIVSTSNSGTDCGSLCYNNCSCTAYAITDGIGCMLWTGSLIDLQKFSSNGVDLYVRLAYSEMGSKRNMKLLVSISIITGLIVVAILFCLLRMWVLKQRGRKQVTLMQHSTKWPCCSKISTTEVTAGQDKLEELPLFKFEELEIATESFSAANKLGQGGFGPVYKGKLQDGQEIAVKRLSRSSGQGVEEFMNEVMVISKLQHRNLVRILGCCVEGDEKMLIYEYMSNKSLDSVLFDLHKKELLDWRKRFSIIQGIARGLIYLHRDSRLKIIHRDLKTSNILLDEQLNPKISDFGMARIFRGSEDQVNTERVVGTYGYMAPEYAMEGMFSEKSDVFSFGVLLLEIISGRRNTSFYNDEHSLSLIKHAWKLWTEENIVALVEPTIPYLDFQLEISRCINVGFLCVQEFATDRPTVSTILSMLTSEIAHLPKPNQPAFTRRPTPLEGPHAPKVTSECSLNEVTVTIVEGR